MPLISNLQEISKEFGKSRVATLHGSE